MVIIKNVKIKQMFCGRHVVKVWGWGHVHRKEYEVLISPRLSL